MRRVSGTDLEAAVSRVAPFLLAIGAVLSVPVALYFGRDTIFTGDEMVWIIASPGMDLSTALQSHGGHLQLIPRSVYRVMLEVFGLTYWPYRLLTALTVAGTGILLYRYLIRRVSPAVALMPCLIVMFFGSDPLHVLRGNGFTIVFSIACGIAALQLLETRRSHRADLAAAGLLLAGIATYSTALPFVAGAAVLLALDRSWRRLWVPAVPVVAYGIWKIWQANSDSPVTGTGVDPSRLVNIPEWIFDALAASLSAVTGWGYGFTEVSEAGPSEFFGGVLAVAALVAIVVRLTRGRISTGIWVSLAIGFTLWSMQCLAADPNDPATRAADDPRYLYPGAVAVILIGCELCSGWAWRNWALVLLLTVGAFGLASNISQMDEYGGIYREQAEDTQVVLTAAGIHLDEVEGSRVTPNSEPVITADTALMLGLMARRPFGGVDLERDEIAAETEAVRTEIDEALADYQGLQLAPVEQGFRARRCREVEPAGGAYGAALPGGDEVLIARGGSAEVSLARFADGPSVSLGTIPAGKSRALEVPPTVDPPPWRLIASTPALAICRG